MELEFELEVVVKGAFFAILFYLIAKALGSAPPLMDSGIASAVKLFKKRKTPGFINRVEKLIKVSGIEKKAPFFNVCFFIFLTIIIFIVVFLFSFRMMRSLSPALGIGITAGYLPKAALELLRIINIRRVRSNYHGFLSALAGFYALSGDIVGAFRRAADYTAEPLKTYIKEAVYKYDKSGSAFDVCLDELAHRAGERELLKLLKFTKICLLYGGDYLTILEKLNNQSQRMENARLSLYTSAYVGIIVILVMTFIDLVGLAAVFTKDRVAAGVLSSTMAGNGLVLMNLAAVVFGNYTSFRLFKAGGGG